MCIRDRDKTVRAKDAAKAFSSGSAPASYDPIGSLVLPNSRGGVPLGEFIAFLLPLMRRSATDCLAALEICAAITRHGEGGENKEVNDNEMEEKWRKKHGLEQFYVHIYTKAQQQENIAKIEGASTTTPSSVDPDARAGRAMQRLCSRIIAAVTEAVSYTHLTLPTKRIV